MLQKELAKRLRDRFETEPDGDGWLAVSSDGMVLCQEKVQVKHELFTSIIRFMPHLFPCVLILSSISFHTH